jgi:uncharacterized membrane protein
MKIITYYLLLLIFIALFSGFLVQHHPSPMSMQQMLSVSLLLGLYVVAMSFVGEGKTVDERETAHRYSSNRNALISGTIILSLGILYQLFITHALDYWLLTGLIAINLVKIISLIYSNYNK